MAKFTFECENCGSVKQIIVSHTKKTIQCECGSAMQRKLPTSDSKCTVKEIVDPYTNQQQIPDQKDCIKERHEKYFWTVEMPRLVQSGKYCISTILRNGWGIINDKGELELHTKPPSER